MLWLYNHKENSHLLTYNFFGILQRELKKYFPSEKMYSQQLEYFNIKNRESKTLMDVHSFLTTHPGSQMEPW